MHGQGLGSACSEVLAAPGKFCFGSSVRASPVELGSRWCLMRFSELSLDLAFPLIEVHGLAWCGLLGIAGLRLAAPDFLDHLG